MASKFNERDEELIKISELQKECRHTFTYKNIVACEAKILQELKWNCTMQTPLHYIKLFYSTGIIFSSDNIQIDKAEEFQVRDLENENQILSNIYKGLKKYWIYFADFSTLDYYMIQFREEVIALAWIIWARKANNVSPDYSENFEAIYNIKSEEVQPAFERLWRFYQEWHNDSISKDTSDLTPSKTRNIKLLLREDKEDYQTPNGETK